ncbi:MAG: hypothetical protein AAFS10_16300 [Myxococcota bacterium]
MGDWGAVVTVGLLEVVTHTYESDSFIGDAIIYSALLTSMGRSSV